MIIGPKALKLDPREGIQYLGDMHNSLGYPKKMDGKISWKTL